MPDDDDPFNAAVSDSVLVEVDRGDFELLVGGQQAFWLEEAGDYVHITPFNGVTL